MAVIEERKNLGDLLIWELDRNYCREVATVAAGQNLKAGAVVGTVAETGLAKAVFLIPAEYEGDLDGSENAVGVLLEDADATSGAKKAVTAVRAAVIAEDGIVFPAVPTDVQKKKIVADLDARGIVIRKTV
jgi:hypothetical protein